MLQFGFGVPCFAAIHNCLNGMHVCVLVVGGKIDIVRLSIYAIIGLSKNKNFLVK